MPEAQYRQADQGLLCHGDKSSVCLTALCRAGTKKGREVGRGVESGGGCPLLYSDDPARHLKSRARRRRPSSLRLYQRYWIAVTQAHALHRSKGIQLLPVQCQLSCSRAHRRITALRTASEGWHASCPVPSNPAIGSCMFWEKHWQGRGAFPARPPNTMKRNL